MEQGCRQQAHASGTIQQMVKLQCKQNCKCIFVTLLAQFHHFLCFSKQGAVQWGGRTSPHIALSLFLGWPFEQYAVLFYSLIYVLNTCIRINGYGLNTTTQENIYFIITWQGCKSLKRYIKLNRHKRSHRCEIHLCPNIHIYKALSWFKKRVNHL